MSSLIRAVASGLDGHDSAQRGAEPDLPALRPHRLQVHRVFRRALTEELALRRRAERVAVRGEQVRVGRSSQVDPSLGLMRSKVTPVEAGRRWKPVASYREVVLVVVSDVIVARRPALSCTRPGSEMSAWAYGEACQKVTS